MQCHTETSDVVFSFVCKDGPTHTESCEQEVWVCSPPSGPVYLSEYRPSCLRGSGVGVTQVTEEWPIHSLSSTIVWEVGTDFDGTHLSVTQMSFITNKIK